MGSQVAEMKHIEEQAKFSSDRNCPFKTMVKAVWKFSKFRAPAFSFRNLWIVAFTLGFVLRLVTVDEILAGLGARVGDLKEIGLSVLDMLFGFIGGVVQSYDGWRGGNEGDLLCCFEG
ncbi:hypothetical protein IFR05_012799 [Cadophora sp. M221]|nr:hypothetical protein IFR05_012799 [Cadophora sp. M221]